MKRFFTLLIVIASISSAFAQSEGWTIGLTGGLLNYYGDVTEYSTFNPAASRPAGALSIENRFGKFLRPQFQVMAGQLQGEKAYIDAKFESLHIEGALKLGFDAMGFVNPESKLEVSPNAQLVAAYYNPVVTRVSNGEEITQRSHVNQGENFGFGLGWGGRVGYRFNPNWRAIGGLDMRYYLTNQIDAYDGLESTTNDWLSYIYAGVGYTLTPKEKNASMLESSPSKLFNGQFTYNNLPEEGVGLELYDENDNLLSTTTTDNSGNFNFAGLEPGSEYSVKVAEANKDKFPGGKLYAVNENNEKVAIATKESDRFVYTHISQDEVATMEPVKVDKKETTMKGLFTHKKLAKGGVKLNLYNQSDEKIASTVTDLGGKFKFEGLSPDEVYMVKLNEDDKGLYDDGKLYILNSEGKRVAVASKPEFNEYKFEHITRDETDMMPVLVESDSEAKMRGVFTYNELPKAGVKLFIVDEEGNEMDSVMTGVDGSFQFSQLDPNKVYLVKIQEGDMQETEGIDIFFLNENDEPVMRAATEKGGLYAFEAMEEEELSTLQVLHAEIGGEGKLMYRRESVDGEFIEGERTEDQMDAFDLVGETPDSKDQPKKTEGSNIYNVSFEKETIFFEHDKYTIEQNQAGTKGSVIAKKMKDNPAMRVRVEGYASTPGTEAYNLKLSQKRADELKKLLVDKYGIDNGRIEAVGKGEDPGSSELEARRARIKIIE